MTCCQCKRTNIGYRDIRRERYGGTERGRLRVGPGSVSDERHTCIENISTPVLPHLLAEPIKTLEQPLTIDGARALHKPEDTEVGWW